MEKYHFERPHLIAAYREEKFIGIFVTYPKETISTEFLADYFQVANPTCFVAAEVPDLGEELTSDNYMILLEDMIADFTERKFSELTDSDLLFIPKTLH